MSYGLNTASPNSILHPRRVKSAAERTLIFASCQSWSAFCRHAVILHIALNIRMVSAPLSNMFTQLRELTRVDNLWYTFVLRLESNVRHCKKRHKTASFSSNLRFWSFALNIRMVSAPLSNTLALFIELTIPGMFLYYDLNKMFGSE